LNLFGWPRQARFWLANKDEPGSLGSSTCAGASGAGCLRYVRFVLHDGKAEIAASNPLMIKISAVIITYNEEKNVGKCIDSLRTVADEIVVIDSFSKDRTRMICERKGVRFVENPFKSHIDQKNFAVGQASYEHVLSLDADEYLSEDLIESILKIKESWPCEAYRMNRLSNYGGKWIKHGQWYPDRKIRLWNRSVGVWGGENPHDKVILKAGTKIMHLEGDLLHRAYKNSSETLLKIERYSGIFAQENLSQKSSSVFKILMRSSFAFFKSYVLKRGFLDGFEGLMVAGAVSNHVFYKYAKLYEANHREALGKRVIISRTDNLGDVILTLPLLGYLKSEIPEIEIFFIGKKYTQPILEHCIFVDHFLDMEDVLSDPMMLSRVKADSIVFIYPDEKLAAIAKRNGIRKRVATSHRWYNWLYCNYVVDFSRLRSNLHESQLNFKLLTPFKMGWDIDVNELSSFYGLQAKREDFDGIISRHHFNLIIHPKTKGSAKEWGLENFNRLIHMLPPSDFKIFITGLKEEGDAIRKELPELLGHPHVTDLTGRLSLEGMISFVSSADGLLACSTGVLHLAAALGKYALGIYAPIKPIHPGRWKPIGPHARYLVLDKECNQCGKDPHCTCILSISPAKVKGHLVQFAEEYKTQVSV
jgi:heptosyltransferase-3